MNKPENDTARQDPTAPSGDCGAMPCYLPPEYWLSIGETIRHMETLYSGGKYGGNVLAERIDRLISCYESVHFLDNAQVNLRRKSNNIQGN